MPANWEHAEPHTRHAAESPARAIRKGESHPYAAPSGNDDQPAIPYSALGGITSDDTGESAIGLSCYGQWKVELLTAILGFKRDAEVLALGGRSQELPVTYHVPAGDGRRALRENRATHGVKRQKDSQYRLHLAHDLTPEIYLQ